MGVGALGATAVCRIIDAHTADPEMQAGDLQRAQEEFQDTMAESLAASQHHER
jgi:hypothetical protein